MIMIFFCVHTPKREKENNIGITSSIINAYSGGVKQQGRAANGPFGLQVKQPPRGDENVATCRRATIEKKQTNIGSLNSFCSDV